MSEITYKELAEKYMRRERSRNIVSVSSGVVAVIIGIRYLRALRADQRAVTGRDAS
jgi:hypothetical protein